LAEYSARTSDDLADAELSFLLYTLIYPLYLNSKINADLLKSIKTYHDFSGDSPWMDTTYSEPANIFSGGVKGAG
jgi:hypothetical protein